MNLRKEVEKALRKNGFSNEEIKQYFKTFNGKLP
jgi:DNA-binding transcriptional MerR regulator